MQKWAILHTNDIHSHFENIPDLYYQLHKRRQQLEAEGYEVITVDIGDCCDRFHPLTEATLGQVNVELLNELGTQYFTIGNNEGLGLPKKILEHYYDKANGQCLLANLYDGDVRPSFVKSYIIHQTKAGENLVFIGLTAPYPESYGPLGWNVTEPIQELKKLHEQVELPNAKYILLSHLGLEVDKKLAEECPFLTIIIGGHTHHLLENGLKVNQTLLTAAKKYGYYFGEITFNNGEYKATIHQVKADLEFDQALRKKGQELLAKEKYLTINKGCSPANFTERLVKALCHEYKADLAILNDGLCVSELKAGEITKATLHEKLPHPMHPLIVKIKGYELQRLFFEMQKNQPFLRRFQLTGFGFRGKVFGNLIAYSSVDLQKIDLQRTYKLVTVDHYQFIPYFPTIAYATETEIDMNYLLREITAKVINRMFSDERNL